MRWRLLLAAVLVMISATALAHSPPSNDIDFYFAVDVPTDLPLPGPSTTVLPWVLARQSDSAVPTYTLSLAPAQPLAVPLPPAIDACHLLTNGEWLFSVAAPMDDPAGSGTLFLPGDVIRHDPFLGTYNHEFCGSLFGLADGVNVDAAFTRYQNTIDGNLYFQRDGGNLVVSFDVPTSIGGVTYRPADLVELRRTGALCHMWAVAGRYFDSQSAGVPESRNLTGADERGGVGTNDVHRLLLTFDVPTDNPASGSLFLPGDIASWDVFNMVWDPSAFHRDPGWPLGTAPDGYTPHLNALCLLASPGQIPDTPPLKLEISKGPGAGQITLDWNAGCSIGAEDYGIHEGTLPANASLWVYDHDDIDCSDNGGDLQEVVSYGPNNHYYLVVPWNPNDEGSYGQRSVPPLPLPTERPPSSPYPNCESNQTNMRELSCP